VDLVEVHVPEEQTERVRQLAEIGFKQVDTGIVYLRA
jgi:hypothetical protein